MKLSGKVLSQPFANVINNSITKEVFSDNIKVAFVSPVAKQANDKY